MQLTPPTHPDFVSVAGKTGRVMARTPRGDLVQFDSGASAWFPPGDLALTPAELSADERARLLVATLAGAGALRRRA